MASTPFVETVLMGMFEPGFVPEKRVLGKVGAPTRGMMALGEMPSVRIHDARHLQAEAAADASFSEAAFFESHGFVLLPHASSVEDWEVDPASPDPGCDVVRVYMPEIEAIIRERLLPGRRVELFQAPLLRRGPGTANPAYGSGVHQDYGLSAADYQESVEAFATPEAARAWRQRYEQDDVEGFMVINFWRPVYLNEPLHHMPLAFCDPGTVGIEDCVPMAFLDFTPTGKPTNQLGLRHEPSQAWHYYPGMTTSEVLAFKNFQCVKGEPITRVYGCFHSAFEEPGTPEGVEERQSCEHRVSVFLLRG